MGKNMTVIREPKTFSFSQNKYVAENLKHEIKFIIKGNGYLAENKKKNEME